MSVSIYDIAKRLGVSPSTVSRGLQDHPRIGKKTKAKIRQLAKEMGYIPSDVARSLSESKTRTIGMVMTTVSDLFVGKVVEGVEECAIEAGYNVFLNTHKNDPQRERAVLEAFQRRRVDGLIALTSHIFDHYPQFIDQFDIPVVIINDQHVSDKLHTVSVDDGAGAKLAVEHLIALGHRRIGYVGVGNRPKSNPYRLQGYQSALQRAGITSDSALIVDSHLEDHAERGKASLKRLLAAGATAVFCYNDMIALGLLSACSQHGLLVPDDLSVIGFDNISISAYTIPPLTTIHQPRFKLGQLAMRMMLELINGQTPDNQRLLAELIIRQSTAPISASRT